MESNIEKGYEKYLNKIQSPTSKQLLDQFCQLLAYKYIHLNLDEFQKKMLEEFEKYRIKFEDSNDDILDSITKLKKFHQVDIPSIFSFGGGIVTQEIVKFLTKSIQPSEGQIFTFPDVFSIDFLPDMMKVMGSELKELNVLVIGAGATGSEILKDLAMMKVGKTTSNGVIVVDDDKISESNLTRQMFYGKDDIGKYKVDVIGQRIQNLIDPSFKIHPIKERIQRENINPESFFNSQKFWSNLDLIISAVDNQKTRVILTEYSTFYNIPLLNCGTDSLGAVCDTYIPYYSKPKFIREISTESAKSCTGKTFPYLTSHAIDWGISVFQELYKENMKRTQDYIKSGSPPDVSNELKNIVSIYGSIFKQASQNSFISLIDYIYDKYFKKNLQELINITKETEYSEIKRKPKIIKLKEFKEYKNFVEILRKFIDLIHSQHQIEFDKDNMDHLKLVMILSNMRCENFNIIEVKNVQEVLNASEFQPSITTSSSSIAGLLTLEIYKIIQRKYKMKKVLMKNSTFELGKHFNYTKTDIQLESHHPNFEIVPFGVSIKELGKYLQNRFGNNIQFRIYFKSLMIIPVKESLSLSIHQYFLLVLENEFPENEFLRFDVYLNNDEETHLFFKYNLK